MSDLTAETLAIWPEPPTTPVESLLHTVRLYDTEPDEKDAVIATSGIYGPDVRTGLTWGDLRAIAAEVQRLRGELAASDAGFDAVMALDDDINARYSLAQVAKAFTVGRRVARNNPA